ncbi:DUF1730 domain-containing protein [bacterium]|nr:DUF1730 domain-containing protein [bacterium]
MCRGDVFEGLLYTEVMMNDASLHAGISDLTQLVFERAFQLGFDLCGIVPIGRALHSEFFERWLALGRAGEMRYLERFVEKRVEPERLARGGEEFRSVIVVGVDYGRVFIDPSILADPSRGVIARYAWRADYHDVMRPSLYALDGMIRAASGRERRGKALVDTGPVLERDWARSAGLGFTGKNCCTIHPVQGSWLLLGTLMVPEVFDYKPVVTAEASVVVDEVADGLSWNTRLGRWEVPVGDGQAIGTCGGCTRCLSACPTDAFVGPLHLDPALCISYWTIESRQAIPRRLRSAFGNRIFGCDVCQEVCPWNRRRTVGLDAPGVASAIVERVAPSLLDGFRSESPYWLDDVAFATRFAGSPLLRAGRVGLLRNVCVALGNWGDREVVDALRLALCDADPLPRGHAAWALGQVGRGSRRGISRLLQAALAVEESEWVREEIEAALAGP